MSGDTAPGRRGGVESWIPSCFWPGAAAVLLAAAFAAESPAQQLEDGRDGWALEARAGAALPAGELARAVDAGPAVELGAVYWFTPDVAARVDLGLDRYGETSSFGPYEEEGPGMRLWRTTAGVQFRFTEQDVKGWSTILGAGAGAASLETDSFLVPVTDRTVPFELTETYPALYGRVRAGYEVSARVRLHFGVQGHLILASEEDTRVFEAATGGRVEAFGATGTVPVTVGVELAL